MQGNSLQSNNRLGTVDIHFTSTTVHGTLILERELEEAELTKLIEQIEASANAGSPAELIRLQPSLIVRRTISTPPPLSEATPT